MENDSTTIRCITRCHYGYFNSNTTKTREMYFVRTQLPLLYYKGNPQLSITQDIDRDQATRQQHSDGSPPKKKQWNVGLHRLGIIFPPLVQCSDTLDMLHLAKLMEALQLTDDWNERRKVVNAFSAPFAFQSTDNKSC